MIIGGLGGEANEKDASIFDASERGCLKKMVHQANPSSKEMRPQLPNTAVAFGLLSVSHLAWKILSQIRGISLQAA